MPKPKKYELVDIKTGKAVDRLSAKEMKDLESRLIRTWNFCTDNKDIMRILHRWIGGGRDNYRTIVQPFFIISSTDPERIVTFWEDGDGGAQLVKGEQFSYFDTPFDEKSPSNRRGSILEAFARIEFILDHLTLIQCGVYTDTGNPKFTLKAIRSQNVNSKVKGLRNVPELRDVDFAAIERIRNLRNQIAHQYSVEEIEFKGIKMSRGSGNGHQITAALNDDYSSAIVSLFQAYITQQESVIEWLLKALNKKPVRLNVELKKVP